MDKETLSNYGWIVICVLVMVVMIALAGPFGNFVSEAVQSTTKGLFDVNKNALDNTGLMDEIPNQEFDVPNTNAGTGENEGSGETPLTPSEPETPTETTNTFTIKGTEYQADAGMTWAEWLESDYNTPGYVRKIRDENALSTADKVYTTESWCAMVGYNNAAVSLSDTIIFGAEYTIDYWDYSPIEITIQGVVYDAEEGMTWGEWIESIFNTAKYVHDSSAVYNLVIDYTGTVSFKNVDNVDQYGLFPLTTSEYIGLDADTVIVANTNYFIGDTTTEK